MRKLLGQIEWGSVGAFLVGAVAIGFLVLLAMVMWKGGQSGHIGASGEIRASKELNRPQKEELDRLQKYAGWGESLNSRDPERMRATLKEMQREGFDKKNLEEFKRLRDKYGHPRRP